MSADLDYKSMFSRKEMVEDLARNFFPPELFVDARWDTLESYKSSFITEFGPGLERHSDLVWRLQWRDRDLYLYLLFEFQSTVQRWMALRMLTYVGLLYQEVAGKLQGDQPLPLIFPIVIYSGDAPRWQVATSIGQLFSEMPEAWQQYVPQMRYFLLDQGAFSTEALFQREDSLSALVFLLETGNRPEVIRRLLDKVINYREQGRLEFLREALMRLGARVFRKRFGELSAQFWNDLKGAVQIMSNQYEMLVANIEADALQRGIEQGIERGIEQGARRTASGILHTLILRRFGPLPDWARSKIEQADLATLQCWTEMVLDAQSLDALLK